MREREREERERESEREREREEREGGRRSPGVARRERAGVAARKNMTYTVSP